MIPLRLVIMAMAVAFIPLRAAGQTSSPAPRAAAPGLMLAEKSWEKLSNKKLMEFGEKALGADPHRWKHGETEHFVFHFQELADAQTVGELAEAY